MSQNHKYISKDEALIKLQAYCAYQDRCHSEVRTKLLGLKIYGDDLEDIITELIKENFLNEERFARSYARGKFRIKNWGKRRIIQELKKRRISDYCIKKALTEIDEDEYTAAAEKIITKYFNALIGLEPIKRKKTYEHAARKGYEPQIINSVLNKLRKSNYNG